MNKFRIRKRKRRFWIKPGGNEIKCTIDCYPEVPILSDSYEYEAAKNEELYLTDILFWCGLSVVNSDSAEVDPDFKWDFSEVTVKASTVDGEDETVDLSRFSGNENKADRIEYKGPSVVSYSLDGRKASRLSIPAYRCMGGGEVTVLITVDPQGNVLNAKIYDDVSSSDPCLREFAVRAARLSRFSALPQNKIRELPRQKGEIVYKFIAQ